MSFPSPFDVSFMVNPATSKDSTDGWYFFSASGGYDYPQLNTSCWGIVNLTPTPTNVGFGSLGIKITSNDGDPYGTGVTLYFNNDGSFTAYNTKTKTNLSLSVSDTTNKADVIKALGTGGGGVQVCYQFIQSGTQGTSGYLGVCYSPMGSTSPSFTYAVVNVDLASAGLPVMTANNSSTMYQIGWTCLLPPTDVLYPNTQYSGRGQGLMVSSDFFSYATPPFPPVVNQVYKTFNGWPWNVQPCNHGAPSSQQCNGNGACDLTSATCSCSSGFTGTFCQTPVQPQGCHPECVHGQCVDSSCQCDSGWQGSACDQPVVHPLQCAHGSLSADGTKCICFPGWKGVDCAIPDGACPDKVCVHGTCQNGKCTCDTYWSGTYCDEIICMNSGVPNPQKNACKCPAITSGEYCQTVLCVHGDVSSDGSSCVCDSGWSGNLCQTIVCQHGGVANASKTACQCPAAFSGTFCETDNCSPNGSPSTDFKSCVCKQGWTGDHCQTIDCQNGGTPSKDGKTCSCPKGYTGDFCEITPCEPNGTLNKDGTCTCKQGWTGDHCQTIDCQNGGTPSEDGKSCSCPKGYTGDFCENAPPKTPWYKHPLVIGFFATVLILVIILLIPAKKPTPPPPSYPMMYHRQR